MLSDPPTIGRHATPLSTTVSKTTFPAWGRASVVANTSTGGVWGLMKHISINNVSVAVWAASVVSPFSFLLSRPVWETFQFIDWYGIWRHELLLTLLSHFAIHSTITSPFQLPSLHTVPMLLLPLLSLCLERETMCGGAGWWVFGTITRDLPPVWIRAISGEVHCGECSHGPYWIRFNPL